MGEWLQILPTNPTVTESEWINSRFVRRVIIGKDGVTVLLLDDGSQVVKKENRLDGQV